MRSEQGPEGRRRARKGRANSPGFDADENLSLAEGRLRLPQGLDTLEAAETVEHDRPHIFRLRRRLLLAVLLRLLALAILLDLLVVLLALLHRLLFGRRRRRFLRRLLTLGAGAGLVLVLCHLFFFYLFSSDTL